jgi:hypothetical protein
MKSEQLKTFESGMEVNVWDLVSQVIESRRDPRDVIREYLSNACAKEIEAHNIRIVYYNDPSYGPSLVLSDDGIGMNYTGNIGNPGRLDRFIAVAYGGHAGLKSDEFGHKGLGSKLAANCKRLEIRTRINNTDDSFFVFVDEPIKTLRDGNQPIYKIVPGAGLSTSGTEIKILGYEYGESSSSFDINKLELYLYFNTILGYTRDRQFPKFTMKVETEERKLAPGFRYLNNPSVPNWKTYVLSDPIIKKKGEGNNSVTVTLKGGYTLETTNEEIINKYSLRTGTHGLFLSIKGIPYVQLDFNQFRGSFSKLQYKFVRFVVECDELFSNMDFARNTYLENQQTANFEKALKECFNELSERVEYKDFLRKAEEENQKNKRINIDKRKEELEKADQQFVYVKKTNQQLHRLPKNEHDTLALMWKLESLKLLPFDSFISLEHTNIEGIDVIANYRETPDAHTQKYAPIEVEHIFENFYSHGHNANQVTAVICWDVDDESRYKKIDGRNHKLITTINEKEVPIYRLSKIEEIELRDNAGRKN